MRWWRGDSSLRFAPFRMTRWRRGGSFGKTSEGGRWVWDGVASIPCVRFAPSPLRWAKGKGPPPSPLLKEGEWLASGGGGLKRVGFGGSRCTPLPGPCGFPRAREWRWLAGVRPHHITAHPLRSLRCAKVTGPPPSPLLKEGGLLVGFWRRGLDGGI